MRPLADAGREGVCANRLRQAGRGGAGPNSGTLAPVRAGGAWASSFAYLKRSRLAAPALYGMEPGPGAAVFGRAGGGSWAGNIHPPTAGPTQARGPLAGAANLRKPLN